MEETLGKRIAAHRKRLGLTQDKLAEALGVTAQAVSKWENDQSCPDISMLPKLSEIFGITTDELLGLEPKAVHSTEVIQEEDISQPEGLHIQNGDWEFQWDGGRKSSLSFALWLILVGALAILSYLWPLGSAPSLWTLAWTTGLLVFGLFGLYPRFRFFRLGCALAGGYFLLNELNVITFYPEWKFILPGILVLVGLSLLFDSLHKPEKGSFHISRNGKVIRSSAVNSCTYEEETFSCATCFGENDYLIQLPRLSGGEADVSFGEMTVDLRGCEALSGNCRLQADCSFGQMTLLVPRRFRAECSNDTAFGSVETKGIPDPGAAVFSLDCSVSFGQITVCYL